MTVFIVFLFGLCLGSFLNVLIDRLPNGESVLWGRSRCDRCKKTLRWFELIPLLSFVLQKARCRRCHVRLSFQYPLIELLSAILFTFLFSQHYSPILLFSYSFILFPLLVIFAADLKYQIIPDSMIIVGIIGEILYLASQGVPLQGWMSAVVSGIGASMFFFALWLVTRGRGMGLGDVKLSFLLGLLLGFPKIVIALYGAFLTGAIVGVILILGKALSLKSKIAFGPFLIIGTFISVVWGEKILAWWRTYL